MKFTRLVIAGAVVAAVPASAAWADHHADGDTKTQMAEKAEHTPEGAHVPIPVPPEGKGQVVFYRTGGLGGMAMGCTVHQGTKKDKTKITSVGSGRYVVVVAEPGKQEYWVKNEKKDGITLLVEEGETQFVRCKIKMGIMSGRPDISPSDDKEFVNKSKGLKLVDDEDMGEGALRAADM